MKARKALLVFLLSALIIISFIIMSFMPACRRQEATPSLPPPLPEDENPSTIETAIPEKNYTIPTSDAILADNRTMIELFSGERIVFDTGVAGLDDAVLTIGTRLYHDQNAPQLPWYKSLVRMIPQKDVVVTGVFFYPRKDASENCTVRMVWYGDPDYKEQPIMANEMRTSVLTPKAWLARIPGGLRLTKDSSYLFLSYSSDCFHFAPPGVEGNEDFDYRKITGNSDHGVSGEPVAFGLVGK